MRSLPWLLFLGILLSPLSAAQAQAPVEDVLGVHANGGRGCVGCHPPHYNPALMGPAVAALAGRELWFGDGGQYPVDFVDLASTTSPALFGISMCLGCHDGNIAKGGMMTNVLYEKAAGLLPANVYGPNTIPTLLGNDGSTPGNYENDHPVGPSATLGAVGVAPWFQLVNSRLQLNTGAKDYSSQYGAFIKAYGAPSLLGGMLTGFSAVVIPAGATDPSKAFITCVTCHDPHRMNVYTPSAPIAGSTSGSYTTYMFVSAPYNPGANPNPTQASSATQFCRQCHFDWSNESDGITGITTAF